MQTFQAQDLKGIQVGLIYSPREKTKFHASQFFKIKTLIFLAGLVFLFPWSF